MSLSSWLMPIISERLLSLERLQKQRARQEAGRRKHGAPHVVHYFHQVDDPYCVLTAASLQGLLQRYAIQLAPHIVRAPADAAAPERDKLIAYSRRDVQLLAQHTGGDFRDPGHQPTAVQCDQAAAQFVAAIEQDCFVEHAAALSAALWEAKPTQTLPSLVNNPATPAAVQAHTAAADALRTKLGHYLGATFYYAGEWYWGIDRLRHLERRLQELGAQRSGVSGLMFPATAARAMALTSLRTSSGTSLRSDEAAPAPIEFFFSLRSPYSAIVTPRVFELGRRTGAEVRLRFVLPMVMRGLPVPRQKRQYIALDTAREAREHVTPFGRINDPLGRPTERGLALIPFAEQAGKGQAYLSAFMQGVWAEGIDAGSDRGLRKIVERAGLLWESAQSALKDEAWRITAEENRQAMFALGLWGVPSFQVGDTAVWGQDRLWAIEEALQSQGNA